MILFLVVVGLSHALITPQCRRVYEDIICPAVCVPVCNVTCDYQCTGGRRICQSPPRCSSRCPDDQVVADSCPACETVCEPLECANEPGVTCEALCEPSTCQWACRKPIDGSPECPHARYEIMCEKPACEYQGRDVFSSASSLSVKYSFFLMLLSLLLLLS